MPVGRSGRSEAPTIRKLCLRKRDPANERERGGRRASEKPPVLAVREKRPITIGSDRMSAVGDTVPPAAQPPQSCLSVPVSLRKRPRVDRESLHQQAKPRCELHYERYVPSAQSLRIDSIFRHSGCLGGIRLITSSRPRCNPLDQNRLLEPDVK